MPTEIAVTSSVQTQTYDTHKDLTGYILFALIAGVDGGQYATRIITNGRDTYVDIVESSSVYARAIIGVYNGIITLKYKASAGWSGFRIVYVYGIKPPTI